MLAQDSPVVQNWRCRVLATIKLRRERVGIVAQHPPARKGKVYLAGVATSVRHFIHLVKLITHHTYIMQLLRQFCIVLHFHWNSMYRQKIDRQYANEQEAFSVCKMKETGCRVSNTEGIRLPSPQLSGSSTMQRNLDWNRCVLCVPCIMWVECRTATYEVATVLLWN